MASFHQKGKVVIMANLVPCPTCGREISSNSESCVHCGENSFLRTVLMRTKESCTYCNKEGMMYHPAESGDHAGPAYLSTCIYCFGTKTKYVHVPVLRVAEHPTWEKVTDAEYSRLVESRVQKPLR